jgi:hypothetical protein
VASRSGLKLRMRICDHIFAAQSRSLRVQGDRLRDGLCKLNSFLFSNKIGSPAFSNSPIPSAIELKSCRGDRQERTIDLRDRLARSTRPASVFLLKGLSIGLKKLYISTVDRESQKSRILPKINDRLPHFLQLLHRLPIANCHL